MAFAAPTPQRPLPGAYVQTPAWSRFKTGQTGSIEFASNSLAQLRSLSQGLSTRSQESKGSDPPDQTANAAERQPSEILKPIERAAKTINETLAHDARYPELDSYIGREPLVRLLA